MPRTSPKIAFGLYALAIKQDATPTCPDVQTFSKVNDLITGNVTSKPYATFEPDFWLLDGGYKFKPTTDAVVHVGLWSLSMSDENGDFDTPPALTVTFGSVQDTDGLTLRFASYSVDWASDIDVAYYDASNALIRTDNYTPTSWEFSTGQAVSDFKKIIITFNSTNKPYRYLRLTGIDFGELIYFTGADLKSATIIEEVNLLSLKLPIGVLELSLFSDSEEFDITNPTGIYSLFETHQPLDVYEMIGSEQIYMGRFYLDTWESLSPNEMKITAVDKIGVLEKIDFYGNLYPPESSFTAEEIFETFFGEINVPYELDASLEDIVIYGYVPPMKYRQALQQFCFAIGAYVTLGRSNTIQIKPTQFLSDLGSYDYEITKAEKSMGGNLTIKPQITGVEVIAYKYVPKDDGDDFNTKTLLKSVLTPGIYTIVFDEPIWDFNLTGATNIPLDNIYSYIKINVASTTEVIVTGTGFSENRSSYVVNNETLDENVPKNIIKIDNCKLVNADNAEEIAERIYNYYQQRYLQKTRLFASIIKPGDSAQIETYNDKQLEAIAEKTKIDLSGGFIVEIDLTGNILP